MERLGKVKMDYVKPVTLMVDLDKDLCDVVDIPCGVTGTFTTSKSKYREYQICVHFPYRSGNRYYYSKNNGTVRYIRIKGQHDVTFAGPDPKASSYCNKDVNNGSSGGCGWQEYDTSGNGGCHYFGVLEIDGIAVPETGSFPAAWNGEVTTVGR